MDILVKDDEGWKLYEVKSSTGVKPVYLQDASLQAHVLAKAGIELVDAFIVHINNQYIRKGLLDVWQLFTITSVCEDSQPLLPEVPTQSQDLLQLLHQDEVPEVAIGPHCASPYACEFQYHCWQQVPDHSVFDIRGLGEKKKWALYNQGIQKMTEVPGDFGLSHRQQMQVEGLREGATVIQEEKIQEFLAGLNYPLYYLDFETFGPGVPLFDESRPYQHLPFQYSLRVQQEAGGICQHYEYLGEAD